MRERAIIHITGPKGAGKTTLSERLLHGFDGFVLAARCTRDDKLKELKEAAPRTHPELRRYLEAGASGTALISFPKGDSGSDAFFCTDLMNDFSHAVIIEGDSPVEFADAPLADAMKKNPKLMEKSRTDTLEGIANLRRGKPAQPTTHWAVAEGYEGIERAG